MRDGKMTESPNIASAHRLVRELTHASLTAPSGDARRILSAEANVLRAAVQHRTVTAENPLTAQRQIS